VIELEKITMLLNGSTLPFAEKRLSDKKRAQLYLLSKTLPNPFDRGDVAELPNELFDQLDLPGNQNLGDWLFHSGNKSYFTKVKARKLKWTEDVLSDHALLDKELSLVLETKTEDPPTLSLQYESQLMDQISAVLDKTREGVAIAVLKEFEKAKEEIAAIIEADANTQRVQDGQGEALKTLLENFSQNLNEFLD
tara:strand:- start:991 stop:1572 length:582 start_codon:yes stop_codon:yes gene_type:complete